MKKIFAILLSAMMVCSLAACSGQNEPSGSGSGSSNRSIGESVPAQNSSQPADQPGEPSDSTSSGTSGQNPSDSPDPVGGKTLVVYFSATNNTEAIAGYIASATGADLFELIPTKLYTSDDLDWTDRDSRVSKEHDDESLRAVELEKSVPDNWDEYDTVFIGYPKL